MKWKAWGVFVCRVDDSEFGFEDFLCVSKSHFKKALPKQKILGSREETILKVIFM